MSDINNFQQNTNLSNAIISSSIVLDPFDTFSKIMEKEYQWGTQKSVPDKEIVKKDFVNASSLINKAKKTVRETDFYLKKLNEKVLPRCQSADITSDIIKRNVDIPLQITRQRQHSFKEQLDNNINTNNDKSKPILKPKSIFQEKHVHFDNSSENVQKTNNSQQLTYSSELPELMKDCKNNNVGIVNLKAIPEEKENNNCKVKNLAVQKIPRVEVKPDLVTQKLSNIQIKPVNNKSIYNYKPNIGYHEFAFEIDPEICKCQSLVQPTITNDKTVAHNEIRKIICEMLDNVSSNDPLSDHLINKLQKVMIQLERTKSFENNVTNEIDDLIEEHSMVGFSEIVIKKRLLEIAEHLFESDNDGISFDQMSEEIENNSRHVLKRLSKIKNSILAMNPSMKFTDILDNNRFDDTTIKYTDENPTNLHPNDTIHSKKFIDTTSNNNYVSVREFLCQGSNNLSSSKMFKNASTVKECGSQITLYSNDHIIQNPKTFSSINVLSNINNTAQLKKNQLESKHESQSQIKFLGDFISSKPLLNRSSTLLTPLKSSEGEHQNNNKNIDHTTYEDDNSSTINTEINTVGYKNNNDISLMEYDQLTKCKEVKNSSIINTNIENKSKTQIHDYANCQPNIKEWILNSLSFTLQPSNNNQHTDQRVQILDKEIYSSSSSATSSMIPLKQSNQEAESDTESLISFGEVDRISECHNIDSNSSVGEIKN